MNSICTRLGSAPRAVSLGFVTTTTSGAAHSVTAEREADVEAALEILLDSALDSVIDMVLLSRDGAYEAASHDGSEPGHRGTAPRTRRRGW